MELWIYATSLAPFFHILICNLANSEDPEEMPHDASFHEDPHCLLVPRRSFERQKGIGMLRPVRLRINAYAHLNALTRYGYLRFVVCICAANHYKIQYAQTGKDDDS